MSEEQIIELNEISDQMVEEAIKRDFGVYKQLYHGTSNYNAQKIQRTCEIRTKNKIGYLGSGFYCYLLDVEASKIWARNNNSGKVAVIELEADLGNLFFINKELNEKLKNLAKEQEDFSSDINIIIGFIVENIIKDFIKLILNTDIHTVGKFHIHSKRRKPRQVLMFSLRDKKMVKDIKLCWEE